jgi:primase-polymerase (primpol)-like protein
MATLASFKGCANLVAWMNAIRNGAPTKTPFDAKTGNMAKTDDPSTWSDYGTATKWGRANGAAGVGLVLGEVCNANHVGGIDLDVCRDAASGEITDWGQEVIDRFKTYVEVSPSDTGAKAFYLTNPAAPACQPLSKLGHARGQPRSLRDCPKIRR